MSHLHSVYDNDTHFSINPTTRAITNATAKSKLVQFDHNSERFTFEIPRFVEGHDMTLCDKVEIHYINVSADNKEKSNDVYLVDDMQASPADDSVAIFSWLISANATKYAGILSFLIKFECLDGETVEYAWNTDIFNDITIASGMDNGESVIAEYSDVLEAWRQEVLFGADGAVTEIQAAHDQAMTDIAEVKETLLSEIELAAEIVQSTGESETAVMSQNAVTDELDALKNYSLVALPTRNYFDSNNIIDGKYIDPSNGGMPLLDGYCVFMWEVEPNTTYTRTGDNQNNSAFYDENQNFISSSNSATITTPVNCKYFGVSIEKTNFENVGLFKGGVSGWSKEYQLSDTTAIRGMLEVGEGFVFKTIQSAVDFATDGDIIYIHNGIYHESVSNRYKYLTFIGESKENTILEFENGRYSKPPIEIAKGVIKNMTIHGISQSQQSGEVAKCYCMHTDWQTSVGSNLYIENVKFINDDYQVVGIGLQTDFTLEFVNCDFIANGNTNAFYCHTMDNESAGNQYLIVRNCTMINNGSEYTILMQSQEIATANAECLWQRNIVVNKGVSDNLVQMAIYDNGLNKDNWLGSTDWHNSVVSLQNTASQLNYN